MCHLCNLCHLKQGFDNWIKKIPCIKVGILQCRWVDNQMDKRLLLDDGAQKESVNGFYCTSQ